MSRGSSNDNRKNNSNRKNRYNRNSNGKSNDNSKNRDNRNDNSSRNLRDNDNRNCSNNRKGHRMAIVHVSFKSSSKAPPAAAHAQYIMREGQYHSRGGVELVESGNMPEFAQADPHAFWLAADAHERANGRTYTEIQVALPRELDPAQREELAREATRELMGDRFAHTMAVHVPLAKDNIEQPHMHLMFSERVVDSNTQSLSEDRFFKRNGAKKDPSWNDRNKPEEVREKWVEMMNGAMERAGLEQRLDARSWAEQGREDLAALREEKTLRGDGPEARERHETIAERRQMRAELPALHLDQATAIEVLEKKAEQEVTRIEERRDMEISILDKLIEKARELAIEVKERTTEFARNVVDRVESFFGGGKQGVEGKPEQDLNTQQAIRPPGNEERAGPELKPQINQQIEHGRQAFRERYEAYKQAKEAAVAPEPSVQEKALEPGKTLEKKLEPELEIRHDRGFGMSR